MKTLLKIGLTKARMEDWSRLEVLGPESQLLNLGIPTPSRLKNWPIFFRKSGVRGSTSKWDLGLYGEIPPPILAKLQDGTFAISATNCHPSKNSYEHLQDVSTLAQRGHLSPFISVETCGSMVSPLVSRAKTCAVLSVWGQLIYFSFLCLI